MKWSSRTSSTIYGEGTLLESDQVRIAEEISSVNEIDRVLVALLKEGLLCQRCLAHHSRARLSHVVAVIDRLRQTVAIREKPAECPGCQQTTLIFSLEEPQDEP